MSFIRLFSLMFFRYEDGINLLAMFVVGEMR